MRLGEVVNKLSDYDITITGKYIKLQKDTDVELPTEFKFKTKPYEHQIEGVKFGLLHNKWLLGDEQGLGKTKQVIDIAVAKNVEHCLIVCCVNGLKWNWRNEVHTHSDDNAWILGQKETSNGLIIGTNPERLDDLNYIDRLPRFIITNIETLRYKVKTGRKIMKRVKGRLKEVDEYRFPITEKLQELCKTGKINMIAVDEFHKCKNPDAEQAQQILQVRAPIEIAMTGTPLMNAPLDLYMPLSWLDYERHTFWQFKTHHCNFGGYGGHEVIGYKNLEEIEEVLDTMMLRRLKSEVLDLPEKTLINEYVEMSSEQTDVYINIHAYLLEHSTEFKMANNPLAELIRLRQATGNPLIVSDVTSNAKFDRMEELVEDAVENGQKVVIFSNWTQVTDPAFERLSKKYKGVMITGETNSNIRQDLVDRFQNDDNVKFIIGTIGAMGTGLTLTAGTVEIFLDEPWNMALKEQAIDRCHRIGQNSNITVYTLLCRNTIDERINSLVEKKGQMAEILIDGKIEGDKNALINYLLS
jgi:SNF2 family DNA or RNA helicase